MFVLINDVETKSITDVGTAKDFTTYSIDIYFICRFVKFVEQKEEHDGVHANPPDERSWIVAVNEQQLECMNHNSYELNLFVFRVKEKEKNDKTHTQLRRKEGEKKMCSKFWFRSDWRKIMYKLHISCEIAYHLQCSEILFPPEILLELWSQGREQIIRIHDDVHECVQKTEERTVTT